MSFIVMIFRSYLAATCGPSDLQAAAKHLRQEWGFKDLIIIEDIEKSFVAEE